MSGIIPLRDPSRRFPIPDQRSDILLTVPLNRLSRAEIFSLLTEPQSDHWQHKLDWKNYMRLLTVDGWVFKTSEWHRSEDLQPIQRRINTWKERSRKLKIWHPQ
jgi:hypothetical protein